jgi:iron(III) transport system ATP-binding protein
MAQIDLKGLTKEFDGGVRAVDELDLQIADGEFVSLLGPSGCGKTTTLRCIAGLERPTGGEILFDGTPIVSLERGVFVPPEKRHMGMVFQSYALWPHMTAFANVAYPLNRSKDVDKAEVTRRVEEMLATVGLSEVAGRLPSKLSGGQQQRVALARALVNRPRVVLFDEPFSNLDSILRSQMRREVRNLHERLGTTSVYVTHDRTEAMALSDRVVVMKLGVIQQIGTPREIYTKPANRFVADFIGFDNILKAEVVEASADRPLLRLGGDGPLLRYTTVADHQPGTVVEVAARANAFHLVPRSAADEQCFAAEVEGVTYLGDDVEYRVRVGQNGLIARIPDAEVRSAGTAAPPAAGDTIHLRIAPDELIEING